ncbi:hypothetical protein H6P81_012709 [Aristolochia fimbriata]|uniref:Uncharacterized protein n=1 Tax=Aristolochia fimbriata TaxID=158543 RepID=A0AAV7EFQ3_ARIFI|nr:hypothetical protein H6P81_012709 [Aristolochia fimbriata]
MGGVGRSVLVFIFFVLSVLGFPNYGGVFAEPPRCYYQNIFNFGDSNSATGTNSLPSPYGKTFFGQPSGRASDGRLIIDFMAEKLGLPYLNPYSESAGNNYKNGVNFAAAGATIRPRSQSFDTNLTTTTTANAPTLYDQVQQFLNFKNKGSCGYYGSDKFPQQGEFRTALYTFDIGQNDLIAASQCMSKDQLMSHIPDMINQYATALHQLYYAGARSFWIQNVGPVGCLPNLALNIHSEPENKDQSGCVDVPHNEVVREFNRQLKDKVTELRDYYQDAAFSYVDVYTAKYDLHSKAQQQGFGDPTNFCCGNYKEGGQAVRCGVEGASLCEDPSHYVSWDAVHYTEAANKWIADRILYGGLSDTGSSIYQALLLVFFFVLAVVGLQNGVLAEPPKCNFPAIFNFGDSNSATGTSLPSPYGQTFFGQPSGRASDGRLIIDFMAERLGLPYLNPYSESSGNNYRHGVNFAAGGATVRPQGSDNPPPLNVQVGQFMELKRKGSGHYGEDKYPQQNDFSNALYTFDIGQNDLNGGFQAIPDIVQQISQGIYQLHDAGARSFWIHNTGPVGCLPNHIAYYSSQPKKNIDQFGCVYSENEVAREFNRQLKDKVNELRDHLQDSALTYVDVYTAKYNLISQAQQQGKGRFSEPTTKFCCGNYQDGGKVRCGQEGSSTCGDPSKYLSWDAAHYTEAANKWVADRILYGGLSDTGASIYEACFRRN